MRIKIAIFAVFSSLFAFSQSENAVVDSLKRSLENNVQDSQRVLTLIKIAQEYVYTQPDNAFEWLDKSIDLGNEINCQTGLSKAYVYKGIAFFYNYEFDSTLKYYNKSLEINVKLKDSINIAKVERNIGYIYYYQSQNAKAIFQFKKALQIMEKLNDNEGMAKSLNSIGAIYYDQGNYERALEYYFQSLQKSEETGDVETISLTLSNIGGIYEEQEKYDKALENFHKAKFKSQQINNQINLAAIYGNIGNIFRKQFELDSARYYYEKAVDISTEIEDIQGLVMVYNHMGNLFLYEYIENQNVGKNLNEAIKQFEESQELNQNDLNDYIELCISNKGLGEVYFYKNYFTKSINYYQKALNIALDIESASHIMNIYDGLSATYAKAGMFKKAYESHLLFKSWSDSLRNDENVEALTQMSMQYEFDKQQKEQEFIQMQKELEYQQELKQQRMIRYAILVFLLIVLLFAVQVLRSYQRKKKDNILLGKQKNEIEKQKEEITDSIKYAKRIQTAILPSNELATEILPEHFILFRPRDIVSGDYYWMNKIDNKVIVVAADCTGHGVPGAFMSMLGVSFLNEIVIKNGIHQPNLILNSLRAAVKKTLGQTGKDGEAKDGMDIALCVIDMETKVLQYAGAYNPLYLYRDGELMETKADKMPIGIYIREKESFTNNEIQLQKGDTFYIFSDGFADQFGGPDGGKFKSKPFKRLLGEIQYMSMDEQRARLNRIFDDWRGEIDQIDDVIILGVRM